MSLECLDTKIVIPTYPSGETIDLPIFARARHHQRSSGDVYPCKVVTEAQRETRLDLEHRVIILSNEYLEIAILPELGGKIWYAKDKKKNYNFVYKNHVIKPALIGVLGNWTSGGIEYNWPFHHRPSTFMPVDVNIERKPGEIIVWISEHDPINRMKGMVGVSLKENECIFSTQTKIDNPGDLRRSFLWWENTAVPVNPQYEIFFPEDVNHVHYHYKRSVTSFPIANNKLRGAYNGIYFDGDVAINKHFNSKEATSYFATTSKFNYFGGYDNGIGGGIVHVADRHVSPGKKMFTWAYCQLAKTWENALTDNDGQYAELMASCYSDNQPDFTWLEPNETKTFVQRWFPIHDKGTPLVANEFLALFNHDGLSMQCTKPYDLMQITTNGNTKVYKSLKAYDIVSLGSSLKDGDTISIVIDDEEVLFYEFGKKFEREIPEPRKEYPNHEDIKSAQELYQLGVHVEQYRSPDYSAKMAYEECLKRDEKFTPAYIALARIHYERYEFDLALDLINKAEKYACTYNARLESGQLYYLKGLILLALKNYQLAYDYFNKAAWNQDYKATALLKIAQLDIRNHQYRLSKKHVLEALNLNNTSVIGTALNGYIEYKLGNKEKALELLDESLNKDCLNLYTLFFKALITNEYSSLVNRISTDISLDLLDIISVLWTMGENEEIESLIENVNSLRPLSSMCQFVLSSINNKSPIDAKEGIAYPARVFEVEVLEKLHKKYPNNFEITYLLGIAYYGRRNDAVGMKYFKEAVALKEDYRAYRNLAVGYYTVDSNFVEAKKAMQRAIELAPKDNKQITFEYIYLLERVGEDPQKIIDFILNRNVYRDDIVVELAKCYNFTHQYEKALEVLLNRKFVACEGGEHNIADQYIYANYFLARDAYQNEQYEKAIEWLNKGLVLPQSLGSALWNNVKQSPMLYLKALSLDKLGRREEAVQVVKSYMHYELDYFTFMFQPDFPYYLANAYRFLGEEEKATNLVKEYIQKEEEALKKIPMGYFAVSPFHISFVDDPIRLRNHALNRRLYLYYSYMNNEKKMEEIKNILKDDPFENYMI